MADEVVILITAGSADEASTIARTLVKEHLVACVNILSGVRSVFFWEGRVQDAAESLLLCKSRMARFPDIMERVKSLHSYTVPEIIALPIAGGLPSYLGWIRETTQK